MRTFRAFVLPLCFYRWKSTCLRFILPSHCYGCCFLFRRHSKAANTSRGFLCQHYTPLPVYLDIPSLGRRHSSYYAALHIPKKFLIRPILAAGRPAQLLRYIHDLILRRAMHYVPRFSSYDMRNHWIPLFLVAMLHVIQSPQLMVC